MDRGRPSVHAQQESEQRFAPARHARPRGEGVVRDRRPRGPGVDFGAGLRGSVDMPRVAYHGFIAEIGYLHLTAKPINVAQRSTGRGLRPDALRGSPERQSHR